MSTMIERVVNHGALLATGAVLVLLTGCTSLVPVKNQLNEAKKVMIAPDQTVVYVTHDFALEKPDDRWKLEELHDHVYAPRRSLKSALEESYDGIEVLISDEELPGYSDLYHEYTAKAAESGVDTVISYRPYVSLYRKEDGTCTLSLTANISFYGKPGKVLGKKTFRVGKVEATYSGSDCSVENSKELLQVSGVRGLLKKFSNAVGEDMQSRVIPEIKAAQ